MSCLRPLRLSSRTLLLMLPCLAALPARGEAPYLYGIHDFDPLPQEYLNHFTSGGTTGWVTATVGVGHNPGDTGGIDFRSVSNGGHTVICRINNGYCDVGTIPLPADYANFATRCANFVAASQGCTMWIIGNETNLASEWPPSGTHKAYVSPQDYANCFVQCYNAIKAVRPTHQVISQALGPFGGPYGSGNDGCGFTHDAMPLNWVTYLNQMLTAIRAVCPGPDGIALHINSRGYSYADIHSTQQVNAGGQMLYFSFYVYQDWINYGIPPSMYNLPLYATECNGVYYWSGGHPENPASHYLAGWMQEIYAEINRWNAAAPAAGKPLYHCVNMYRWCNGCDGWNIDGSPYKGQILSDLDAAVAQHYRWDSFAPPLADFTGAPTSGYAPLTVNFTDASSGTITARSWTFGDGGTSTAVNPSYTYTNAGTYTVALTVTGPTGSNTRTRTNYITATAPPPPGSNLIVNGTFDTDLSGWTVWTQRNPGNNFSAAVAAGQLQEQGTNYNAGIWQQFSVVPGQYVDLNGTWRSNPTVASYQWGEVIIINSPRTPVNGVDEGGQADDVLIYKNDTWATPAGWNGSMPLTAPVANVKTFVAAGSQATILLKSGNSGPGTLSGVGFDNLTVKANQAPTAIIAASPLSGPAPLPVHFDATGSSDPEGNPLTYSWNFGDGGTATGPTTDHTFTTPNTWPVTLTANDGRGGVGTATRDILVTGTPPAEVLVEAHDGGQNRQWYSEEGDWAEHTATMCATGTTTGLGSRYASTYRSVVGVKRATFAPSLAAGDYRVYTTWPNAAGLRRSPILYRVTHAGGITDVNLNQTADVLCPAAGDGWIDLGRYTFSAGLGGSVRISNDNIDVSGNMYASAVRLVRVVPGTYRGDLDADQDVDQEDFGSFQRCMSGPGLPQPDPACQVAKLNADTAVDAQDLELLLGCLSGPGATPPPGCAN